MTQEMPHICDARLVGAALAGQREAFARLVGRYQKLAYASAIGLVADFDLAHDIVQEAFLCAFRDLQNLRQPERFGPWLCGIVRHLTRRALRDIRQVRQITQKLGITAGTPDAAPGPAVLAEELEQRQQVHAALRQLRPVSREAISLFYLRGLSYADIAHYLGIGEAAVLGRLQRGRAELKQELLAMVEDQFQREQLPADFAARVAALLDEAARQRDESAAMVKRLSELGPAAVDDLCAALGDQRMLVRRVAARALCSIGDARAIPPILRVLEDGQGWIGNPLFVSGRVLALPGVREELLRVVREGMVAKAYWALCALSRAVGDKQVWATLCAALRDTALHPSVRCGALQALCTLRPAQAHEIVVEGLRDPAIRRHTGYAWWIALKNGMVIPLDLCIAAFGRDVPANSRWMAGELVLRHGAAGVAALERLLRAGTSDEQAAAALALATRRHPQAPGVLRRELLAGYRERKWARKMAAALARCYGDELLTWAAQNPAMLPASGELMWALEQAKLARGHVVLDVAGQGTPTAQADALRELARSRGADAIPELQRRLVDAPAKVAREAWRLLLQMGAAADEALGAMLSADHWAQRKAAVSILRRRGKLNAQQLAAAKQDPHLAVRRAAEWQPPAVEAGEAGYMPPPKSR